MFTLVFPYFDEDGGSIAPDSESANYNCIAWAMGLNDQPWWPNEAGDMHWPIEIS